MALTSGAGSWCYGGCHSLACSVHSATNETELYTVPVKCGQIHSVSELLTCTAYEYN